jgi:hypothetical protein
MIDNIFNDKYSGVVMFSYLFSFFVLSYYVRGRRGRHHMVVGFTTVCAISAYHH